MPEKKKGFLGGLFGGTKEEKKVEPAKAGNDPIQEAKLRTEKLKRETAAKSKAQAVKNEKEKLAVKKHIVVSGDTLSGIAKKYYGEAGKYMKIYEANKAVIGDNPDMIKVGLELVIPKL
ncbi:MAG: LysM peptidoglycan-binding domain-containing protein [Anaerolineales bacterium]|nr:LysM peptidoglycan-binding domain-containing protein [Anaerolineales bacterium]